MNKTQTNELTWLGFLLMLAAVFLPVFALLVAPRMTPKGAVIETESPLASFPDSKIKFERSEVYPSPGTGQMFTHVQVLDENVDGLPDIIACDARRGFVVCLHQQDDGTWQEKILNPEALLPAPVRATPVDLDQDGDQDFLIACLGDIRPSDRLIGRLHWLEKDGDGYQLREIKNFIRRTTDVQPGDFDGDGDIDLIASVFGGLLQGQILYLENDGQQNFTDYEIMSGAGTIHVPVSDFDGDGDLDFAAVITQEEEEVWIFENQGMGYSQNHFDPSNSHRVFFSWNFDLGGAGMVADDLDQDGDMDLLVSLGDNLELINNFPQPWHGCLWLENKGNMQFEKRYIGQVPGVYGCQPADIDNDGDRDVVLVSIFNDWTQPDASSIIVLENDGEQNFAPQQIANDPIQLAGVACGDVDGDGTSDIVTGCFQFRAPFVKLGSVDLFLNKGADK